MHFQARSIGDQRKKKKRSGTKKARNDFRTLDIHSRTRSLRNSVHSRSLSEPKVVPSHGGASVQRKTEQDDYLNRALKGEQPEHRINLIESNNVFIKFKLRALKGNTCKFIPVAWRRTISWNRSIYLSDSNCALKGGPCEICFRELSDNKFNKIE